MNKEISTAYSILMSIYQNHAYSTIELNTALNHVTNCNKALVTKLVYGVMEKDVTLQYIIDQFIQKRPDINVMVVLKLGIYINRYVNSIPNYTMVNELVTLTKKSNVHLSGFVNATLKKICDTKVSLPSQSNIIDYISVKHSIPRWLVSKVMCEHDVDFAVSLFSHRLTDLTHIRIIGNVNEFVKELDAYGVAHIPSALSYTMYVDYAKLINIKSLSCRYVVQGLPSIYACVALMQGEEGFSILDVCSAPGGKSCFIAQNYNCHVTSCDIHAHRLELVKKYAKSLNLSNIEYKIMDATVQDVDFVNKFDKVLIDVPCSNLGLIQKKPDVLINRQAKDIKVISQIQYDILCNASQYVKKGGVLVYSTCTILREENIDIINKFLQNHNEFEAQCINVDIDGVVEENKTYTFYPHLTDTEGFFITKLRRV